jgi:iron(III) transport system ATP-binding protein
MARKPLVMLLDEPFSALDAGLRDTVRRSVARVLAQAGIAAVLVTHDQNEALSFAEQLAVMRDGQIAQAGIPRDLYWRPADERTAVFLGDAVLLECEIGQGSVTCPLGTLRTQTSGCAGRGRIMLRPEQIEVSAAPTPDGRRGTVVAVAFSGSQSTAEIVLDDGVQAPFKARISGIELPAPGQTVYVTVRGHAHLLPAAAGPGDDSR